MSESVTLPESPIEGTNGATPAPSQPPASVGGTAEQNIAHAPVLPLPSALPLEMQAMLELIDRGLAPEADDTTRGTARELWARFTQTIASATPTTPVTAAPAMPPAPMPAPSTNPPAPTIPAMSVMPTVPLPSSPIAMAARTLRQLSPDQLLDLVLQRLRTALPTSATVSSPKGIQFQLVPVTPPSSR